MRPEPSGSRANTCQRTPAGQAAPREGRWLGVEFRHLARWRRSHGRVRFVAPPRAWVMCSPRSAARFAQLERAVGTQLVERSSGSPGATLTPAGEVLLSHVDEILARFEAAHVDLRALADGQGDTVRIGVLDGIGERRMPWILGPFGARLPTDSGDRRREPRGRAELRSARPR